MHCFSLFNLILAIITFVLAIVFFILYLHEAISYSFCDSIYYMPFFFGFLIGICFSIHFVIHIRKNVLIKKEHCVEKTLTENEEREMGIYKIIVYDLFEYKDSSWKTGEWIEGTHKVVKQNEQIYYLLED